MAKEVVGIVGGIGPYAGLDLVKKIYDNTNASCDDEHISTVLMSLPNSIEDRNQFIMGKSEINPSDGIIDILNKMVSCGVTTATIACNAAHSETIFDPIREFSIKKNLKLISIVESTVDYLYKKGKDNVCSVLSVKGTYHSAVYEKALSNKHLRYHRVDNETADHVHEIIWNKEWGIKSKSNPVHKKAYDSLRLIIMKLKKEGVSNVILGCTELPLAITENELDGIRIIDPTLILARDIIKTVAPEKLIDVI